MITPIKDVKGQCQEIKDRDKTANDSFQQQFQDLDIP